MRRPTEGRPPALRQLRRHHALGDLPPTLRPVRSHRAVLRGRSAGLSRPEVKVEPAPYVVAIHVAPGTRLPMKSVASVVAEAGKGIVGDRYHGTRHRHVSVQSATSLAEAA